MNLLSKLIMSKRKRDVSDHDVIIILRGIPGTGKTTMARELVDMFYENFEPHVYGLSRDDMRSQYCLRHNIDYQASFRDPALNTIIRDEFYQHLFTYLQYYRKEDEPMIYIIDATNTKIADLKMTFWIIKHTKNPNKPADVYLYTKRKEYGTVHGVPECIMKRFREELAESDEWLKSHSSELNFK